jgi:hypothetical protein
MKKTHQGLIDRFEGGFAVVLVGPEQEERFDLPKSLLPEDAGEGDLITFSVNTKKNKTAKAKQDVADMIEKLKKRV